MTALKIEYDGQVYEFDELDLDVDEAETIQKYVGRSLGDFSNGLAVCEVKSVVALWWVMRKRAGQNPGATIRPPAGFKPVVLFGAWVDAVRKETERLTAEAEAKEAEPDPTRLPADSSPAPAGTTTTPVPAAGDLSLPG